MPSPTITRSPEWFYPFHVLSQTVYFPAPMRSTCLAISSCVKSAKCEAPNYEIIIIIIIIIFFFFFFFFFLLLLLLLLRLPTFSLKISFRNKKLLNDHSPPHACNTEVKTEGSYTSRSPTYPHDVFGDILFFLNLQKLPNPCSALVLQVTHTN